MKKRKKQKRAGLFRVIIAVSFLIVQNANAAPVITSTSGIISNGQSVTISGSGFGTKNPVAPAKYDPVDGMYPGLLDGDLIPRDNNCPWNTNSVCPWPNSSGSEAYTPVYDTIDYRGKLRASYSNKSRLYSNGVATVGDYTVPNCNSSGVLYVSYWMKNHSSIEANSGSNKMWRIGSGIMGEDLSTFVLTPGHYYIYDSSTCENTVQYFPGYCLNNWDGPDLDASLNQWHRLETTVNNNGINYPSVAIWRDQVASGSGTVPSQNPSVHSICTISLLGADYSNGSTPQPQLDFGEIYVDSTMARIEICNASTKASSTHCEIQIPHTTWNDGQLQVTINQGSFADSSNQYLYVLDSTGVANTNGYQITFGSGSSDITPPGNPTGLSVN